MTTQHTERRYDIDWLRVIAIGLLLIYHIAIVFQPWAVFIGFIQSDEPLQGLWIPMSMLNVWRIPLLFYVSGMGVYFAIVKRNWKQLITERSRRILIPLLFGIVTIVPVHIFLWQYYYHQSLEYTPHVSHLWFLANIFIYVIVLSPLFMFLKRKTDSVFVKFFSHSLSLAAITAVFVLEALMLKPELFELYALTLHGFLLGLLAFFFGFLCAMNGDRFRQMIQQLRWILISTALILFIVRWQFYDLKAPSYLLAIESNAWIFSLFAFAARYLNRGGKVLNYLRSAAYPVYIIHMIFLFGGAVLILPMPISTGLKCCLLILFTITGSMGTFEFVIRRLTVLRVLFGLKAKMPAQKGRIAGMVMNSYIP